MLALALLEDAAALNQRLHSEAAGAAGAADPGSLLLHIGLHAAMSRVGSLGGAGATGYDARRVSAVPSYSHAHVAAAAPIISASRTSVFRVRTGMCSIHPHKWRACDAYACLPSFPAGAQARGAGRGAKVRPRAMHGHAAEGLWRG